MNIFLMLFSYQDSGRSLNFKNEILKFFPNTKIIFINAIDIEYNQKYHSSNNCIVIIDNSNDEKTLYSKIETIHNIENYLPKEDELFLIAKININSFVNIDNKIKLNDFIALKCLDYQNQ